MRILFFMTAISLASLCGIIFGIKLQENSINTTDFKKIVNTQPKNITKIKEQQPSNINNISIIEDKKLENKKTKISQLGSKTDTIISNIFLTFTKIFE